MDQQLQDDAQKSFQMARRRRDSCRPSSSRDTEHAALLSTTCAPTPSVSNNISLQSFKYLGGLIASGERRPGGLPRHEQEDIERAGSLDTAEGRDNKSVAESQVEQTQWMMLCLPRVDGSRYLYYDLHQIGFAKSPTSNAELFRRLKTEYETIRSPSQH
jgi:hypothetical protein